METDNLWIVTDFTDLHYQVPFIVNADNEKEAIEKIMSLEYVNSKNKKHFDATKVHLINDIMLIV